MNICLYCKSPCEYTGLNSSEGCTNSSCGAYIQGMDKVLNDVYDQMMLLICDDKLLEKWTKTHMLEGLEPENQRKMARLLENQTIQMLQDQENFPEQKRTPLQSMMLPLVCRTYRKLFKDNFVDFQPMATPAALAFFHAEDPSEIMSTPVVAHTRKLKMRWRPEMVNDIQAYNKLDAETELTAMLADEMYLDIKIEILRDLTNVCATLRGDTKQKTCKADKESLMRLIVEQSKEYDFMVTSPDVFDVIKGVQFPKIEVHKEPFFFANQILFGKRSEGLPKGYVYCPYMPLIKTPVIYDHADFTPRRAMMMRYAKQMLDGTQYETIKVEGLPFSNLEKK